MMSRENHITGSEYTYMWWAYGWRGQSPGGRRIMNIQTGTYGCAFDTANASLVNLGQLENAMGEEDALLAGNDSVFNLPEAGITWQVLTGGVTHSATGSDRTPYEQEHLENLRLPLSLMSAEIPAEQTRIIDSGRFVQRFDMGNLRFGDGLGENGQFTGRVEVSALPHFMSLTLEVVSSVDITDARLAAAVSGIAGFAVCLSNSDATVDATSGDRVVIMTSAQNWHKGTRNRLTFFLIPAAPPSVAHSLPASALQCIPIECLSVTETSPVAGKITPRHLPERGIYEVPLPNLLDQWDMEHNRDMLERVHIELSNPHDYPVRVPLLFSKEYPFAGVTGITPVLRDGSGLPTGIPVQISKNWHKTKGKPSLYEGLWFHGYTMVPVAPGETKRLELSIAYALWGGVPAASHAQLCLIGYGVNQLWDEAAIGSFGESICYDPDVNLGRAMIDDIRPLLVKSMRGQNWNWTNNVGGGDFLVYFDRDNHRQYLSRMKTWYRRYGPNLTEAHYAGITPDQAISAHIRVSSPRCDDLNRAHHWFRYDVHDRVAFSRLAFYQLGADGYNNHQFDKMAYGDRSGLSEEWLPGKGGLRYDRVGFPLSNDQAWFSLHESIPGLHYRGQKLPSIGAWANRGLVVRSWRARLGGEIVEHPFASVFLTEDNIGSANVELTPPPSLRELLPGDFVECEVEYLVIPVDADDYYGPDAEFRASLAADANTWRPVLRQAAGNDLQVEASRGAVIGSYPVVIATDEDDEAAFSVGGGVSYVPISLTRIGNLETPILSQKTPDGWRPVRQDVHGNDFWQTDYDAATDTWEVTFNVRLVGYGTTDAPLHFRFAARSAGAR